MLIVMKEHVTECSGVAHWSVFKQFLDNNEALGHRYLALDAQMLLIGRISFGLVIETEHKSVKYISCFNLWKGILCNYDLPRDSSCKLLTLIQMATFMFYFVHGPSTDKTNQVKHGWMSKVAPKYWRQPKPTAAHNTLCCSYLCLH